MGAPPQQIDTLVKIKKNKFNPHIFDVELNQSIISKIYHSLDCHIVLYPYSRRITSESYSFNPYEEYVKDILTNKNSAYIRRESNTSNLFGLLLGIFIASIVYTVKPESLYSVEALVSIFGSYIVGKELWDDIENILINLTKNWRLRYQGPKYSYELEKHSTLAKYSVFAKKHRYGKLSLLPQKMDFIEQSNSETVRLYLSMKEIAALDQDTSHILSIRLDKEVLEYFEKKGFMLGVKISFNRHFLGFVNRYEVFQSLHKKKAGCLDKNSDWLDNNAFFRKTATFGHLKWFRSSGLLENVHMIDLELDQDQ